MAVSRARGASRAGSARCGGPARPRPLDLPGHRELRRGAPGARGETGACCFRSARLSDPGALSRRPSEARLARSTGPAAHPLTPVTDNVRYWIATAPVGAASVLAEELAQYGACDIRERSHDVKFQGTLEVGYQACLWSRTATRVLLSVGSIDAGSASSIFDAVKRIDWRDHLVPGATLACDCSGGNESIRHTIYGSQLLKDAVCDSLRELTGERPN